MTACIEAREIKALYLPDGTELQVRPICTDDVERLRRMFYRMSPTTVYRRFFSPVTRPRESMRAHLATVDHDHREALVALDGDEIVAVARYDGQPGTTSAEIAITVIDAWQHRGIGSILLRMLTKRAVRHGYDAFVASMLGDNRPAMSLLQHLAPDARVALESGTYDAQIVLPPLDVTRASRALAVGQPVHEPQP
jgi:GNAT superfamily N-acetyltransferase